jgi:nucleoside-diphosphate-sugar epimerase
VITLVTGGSGFVGSHLADGFSQAGHDVRCLVRSKERPGWLEDKQVELVEGDCTQPETLISAVQDVDVVVHAAGVTWTAKRSRYFEVNAVGTHNLLMTCAKHAPNLTRFMFISSQAAAGPARNGLALTERDAPRPISPYGESKLLAENHVAAHGRRFPCIILRPSAVYGPRDRNFLPYIRMVKRGFLVEFGSGQRVVSLCHVQDLVSCALTAANSQVPSGSVYFVADEDPYAWRDVEQGVCAALDADPRRLTVPEWCLRAFGAVGQSYGLLTDRPVRINTPRAAELLEKRWICDVTKMTKELGFTSSTELTRGLQQLVRWYQEQYWL